MNDYEKQANDFLEKTGASITLKFNKLDKHFDKDEHERFIWDVTISRGNRSFSFKFGDSLKTVEDALNYGHKASIDLTKYPAKTLWQERTNKERMPKVLKHTDRFKPTNYSILACLTKYDPDTFENFCSDFGYDSDSRTAEKTYNAVVLEYKNLCALFNEDEMNELSEIN